MQRTVLWALVGLICAGGVAQAGDRFARRHVGYGVTVMPDYIGPFGEYGRRLRGGYGKNGYAPVFGPVWGPTAFTPGAGKSVDLRPHGSYVRPLGPPEGLIETEPGVVDPAPPEVSAK